MLPLASLRSMQAFASCGAVGTDEMQPAGDLLETIIKDDLFKSVLDEAA